MHPLTKVKIHYKINKRHYEVVTDIKRFREQIIMLFEDLVDRVEHLYYTVGNGNTLGSSSHKVDYYNIRDLK